MIGQRKITLSTSGLVPQIEKLNDFPPVNIAISLHAAHDNIRSELMPINQVYNLTKLFEAIKKIKLKAHRTITYEYLLIADLNDRQIDIDALAKLLNRQESKINIIPFNEFPGSKFRAPTNEKLEWFKNRLLSKNFICTIRISKGQDIMAACGQLKSNSN
jgi:23S rRNA (adenine2503-C2)-methyltransferase